MSGRVAAVLLSLVLAVGCTRRAEEPSAAPPVAVETLGEVESPFAVETPSFAAQVQAVRDGVSRRIEVSEPLSGVEWNALDGLAGLEELVFDEGGLDDAGAQRLAMCPALEKLVARQSPLTDAGFVALARCTTLRELNVPQAACTAEGIAALATLPNLRSLRLGGEKLRGAEVCEAAVTLPKLRFLHLIDIEIGDAGLTVLERRPDLWSLYLDGAGVSDDAWDRYFHACPNVHVHLEQAHHDRDPGADHHE